METTEQHNGNPLALNMHTVRMMLVQFIKDELNNAGFTKAVIGLSGGIDSAVSTYLAVEALGAKNVLTVMMPYKTSSPDSKSDAELIVKELGLRKEIIEITSMVDPLFESQKISDNLRKGNIMARARMIVLYDISQKEKALVIGTSNKTESLLGYGTLFGDMASAINPLGDLYKTHIWELAGELGVPEKIIKKKPTADLWQGQTDEGELGFSYREVDKLLYFMIDERRTDEELENLGFAKSFIAAVRRKVQINQFKRRPPLIAKISQRTMNVDFRYVRDLGDVVAEEIRHGTLYVVPTPIGNLDDITIRALNVLKGVDVIAAEDTRTTKFLLDHYGIQKTLLSFYSHNEQVRVPQIIQRLKNGDSVALVSDAGTPGISDPAHSIISASIANNINIVPLPGATAFVPALVASGFSTHEFVFEGFLPHKKGRKTKLERLKDEKRTIVLYESVHRIEKTLQELLEYFGDRNIVVVRELTKKFEEISRGTISVVLQQHASQTLRGEFVLVIEGSK